MQRCRAGGGGMSPPVDIIPIAPTLTGPGGRAWRVNLDLIRAKVKQVDDAGVALWIVEAPWAHPFWHSYFVSVVHLRPIEGGRPPNLADPRATHELMIFAMDPAKPRHPQMIGDMAWQWLHPANFGAQLLEMRDEDAATRLEGAVSLIVEGELNPDTDAMPQWRALFGDNLIRPEFR